MSFDVFVNFDGNCRPALEFYAKVFAVNLPEQIMTYGEAPGFAGPECDKERILYATLPVFGSNMMFSDCPSNSGFVCGNNVALTLGSHDPEEIRRTWEALSEGATIHMDLEASFFSTLYGMLTDKFGITWQLSLADWPAS